MTNTNSRSNGSLAWHSKMAAGTCLALLMAAAAVGQDRTHPTPSAAQESYEPASVRALPGLQCSIYPEGGAPNAIHL
jgi:hypothetical protein